MGSSPIEEKSANNIVNTIKKHPTIWFFLFAFAISWATIFAAIPLGRESFVEIPGVFAPAIAGIFVAACVNPAPSHASAKKRALVFVSVFVAAVCVFLFLAFMSAWQVGLGFYVSYTVTALIAAYTFSSYYHPVQGVAQMFSGLNQRGKKAVWLLIAAVLPIFFAVGGALINLGLGVDYFQTVTLASILSLVLFIPNMFVYGGPAGEEPGWRGFATPQMQKYQSPLTVGLAIGFLWTVWHLPLYFTGSYPGGVEAAAIRFIWNTALGVTFAWMYNASGGNLLATLILHTSNNIIVNLFAPGNYYMMWAVMIAFTIAAVVASKMGRKTSRLAPVGAHP